MVWVLRVRFYKNRLVLNFARIFVYSFFVFEKFKTQDYLVWILIFKVSVRRNKFTDLLLRPKERVYLLRSCLVLQVFFLPVSFGYSFRQSHSFGDNVNS